MPEISRERSPDSTLALLAAPYTFIAERCRRYAADLFEPRILLRRTVCLNGPEAARLFYDLDRFIRQGAMPRRIRRTLIGEGGVQALDGEAHRQRKAMFLSLLAPERVDDLVAAASAEWQVAIRAWEAAG